MTNMMMIIGHLRNGSKLKMAAGSRPRKRAVGVDLWAKKSPDCMRTLLGHNLWNLTGNSKFQTIFLTFLFSLLIFQNATANNEIQGKSGT